MKTMFAVLFIIAGATAHASVYTGTPGQILSQVSPTTSGNTRVSIATGGTTSCSGYPGWYSFDLPNASVLPTWVATLLAAVVSGKTVNINGSGTCDAYGLEIVASINALP